MRNKKLMLMLSILMFVTLLVIVNSVVFSVQYIDAYCYNADDSAIEQSVSNNSGLKIGESIFGVKESEVATALQTSVPNIKVINVERKFPNRVSVNYVLLQPYLQIENDGNYYSIDNNGKIIGQSLTDPQLIKLKLLSRPSTLTVGQPLLPIEITEMKAIVEVMKALELYNYLTYAQSFFASIDVTNPAIVELVTREGVKFRLHEVSNISTKLRTAISLYESQIDPIDRTKGVIIVLNSNPNMPTYTLHE